MKTIQETEFPPLLNPRLAILVTCCDSQNKANALTIAWHTPLSRRPPLLGISVALTRYSHALLSETGEFVINVVDHSLRRAVEICGDRSGREVDKLALAKLETTPACCVRPPLISGALAQLECKVLQSVEAGDHTLFIAQVLHAMVRDACFDNIWLAEKADPLLYLGSGKYAKFQPLD